MLLVPHALNEMLDNGSFARKKKLMREFPGFELEPEIAKAKKWDEAAIQGRTDRLAKLAYEKIWKP